MKPAIVCAPASSLMAAGFVAVNVGRSVLGNGLVSAFNEARRIVDRANDERRRTAAGKRRRHAGIRAVVLNGVVERGVAAEMSIRSEDNICADNCDRAPD